MDDEQIEDTTAEVEETTEEAQTEQPEAEQAEEADSFPREYVEKLRRENQTYRDRAKSADVLAQRLHIELVRATGRLADPSDLPFDVEHLDDPDKLTEAIEELLTAKPHLANRRPSGDIGQGPAKTSATVDLAALLRSRAG